MMILNKYSLGTILAIAICFIPVFVIWFVYRQIVVFDPIEFSKQYLQFLFSLASMTAGFVLANIIWVKKTAAEKSESERKILFRFFRFVNNLAQQGLNLLNESIPGSNVRQVEHNDQQLRETFKVMALAKQGILLHYPENEAPLDPKLTRVLVDSFWQTIVPIIDRLSMTEQIRGQTTEVKRELENLITASNTVIEELKSS